MRPIDQPARRADPRRHVGLDQRRRPCGGTAAQDGEHRRLGLGRVEVGPLAHLLAAQAVVVEHEQGVLRKPQLELGEVGDGGLDGL